MPLAITLGYTANGRDAVPSVLYCGLEADEAARLSENPPAGITRTEFFKTPAATRRRYYPENAAPAPVEKPKAAAKPAKSSPPSTEDSSS